jgi:hypothetical protein
MGLRAIGGKQCGREGEERHERTTHEDLLDRAD